MKKKEKRITELKFLERKAKEEGFKLTKNLKEFAKSVDSIRKVVREAGIDVKKEFDPNRPHR
jgi:hypothetical protein